MKDCDIPRVWVILLVVAAAILLTPFAGWIILAAWLSGFARPIHTRLTRRLHGHDHLAAVLTVGLLTLVLIPLGVVVGLLVVDAIALISNLAESDRAHSLLTSLVAKESTQANPDASMGELLLSQGDRAVGILKIVAASAAGMIMGLVVLFAGMYGMLVEGRHWYTWICQNAPFDKKTVRRFAEAFTETGRGILIGVAGAGLLQAIVATAAYLLLGVPQALALGFLTLMFSIVPVVGTAIVWVPVAAGLALTGRVYEGVGLAIFGAVVIGSIDNLARPWLTRWGHLQLPGFVVLVAMFSGVQLIGGWGIIYGPLVVRLAKEALELRREGMQAEA